MSKIVEKYKSGCIHYGNLKSIATEMFKTKKNISPKTAYKLR